MVTLVVQFRARRYVAPVYWLAVVLISVVGTLITDNLVDELGVPLVAHDRRLRDRARRHLRRLVPQRADAVDPLDHHARRREAFYWLAILFTFALGTAAGDLLAEKLGPRVPGVASLIFAGRDRAWSPLAHYALPARRGRSSFWIAYVLTRPLGASLGDFLSQPTADGGLGLGTTTTSVIFLATIAVIVGYLSRHQARRGDGQLDDSTARRAGRARRRR